MEVPTVLLGYGGVTTEGLWIRAAATRQPHRKSYFLLLPDADDAQNKRFIQGDLKPATETTS